MYQRMAQQVTGANFRPPLPVINPNQIVGYDPVARRPITNADRSAQTALNLKKAQANQTAYTNSLRFATTPGNPFDPRRTLAYGATLGMPGGGPLTNTTLAGINQRQSLQNPLANPQNYNNYRPQGDYANYWAQQYAGNFLRQNTTLNPQNFTPMGLRSAFAPISLQGQLGAVGYLAKKWWEMTPAAAIMDWWNSKAPLPKATSGPQVPRARAKLNKTKKPAPVYGGGGYGGRSYGGSGGWDNYDSGGGGYGGGGNLVQWRIG
jgi:hypothetical protein